MPTFSDLDPAHWRDYPDVLTESLWLFDQRDGSHGALAFRGSFVPQVARQLILRYSKAGDLVVDLFLGSGTTGIEALRLGRRFAGSDLDPATVGAAAQRLLQLGSPEGDEQRRERLKVGIQAPSPGGALHAGKFRIGVADATGPLEELQAALKFPQLSADLADLVILHPPYHDAIRYSDAPDDLSAVSYDEHCWRANRVAKNAAALLRPGRFAAVVIGDTYRDGELRPLSFYWFAAMLGAGLRPKATCVKNIEGNEAKGKSANLWRRRALTGGFYVFRHEFILIFQKKES